MAYWVRRFLGYLAFLVLVGGQPALVAQGGKGSTGPPQTAEFTRLEKSAKAFLKCEIGEGFQDAWIVDARRNESDRSIIIVGAISYLIRKTNHFQEGFALKLEVVMGAYRVVYLGRGRALDLNEDIAVIGRNLKQFRYLGKCRWTWLEQ